MQLRLEGSSATNTVIESGAAWWKCTYYQPLILVDAGSLYNSDYYRLDPDGDPVEGDAAARLMTNRDAFVVSPGVLDRFEVIDPHNSSDSARIHQQWYDVYPNPAQAGSSGYPLLREAIGNNLLGFPLPSVIRIDTRFSTGEVEIWSLGIPYACVNTQSWYHAQSLPSNYSNEDFMHEEFLLYRFEPVVWGIAGSAGPDWNEDLWLDLFARAFLSGDGDLEGTPYLKQIRDELETQTPILTGISESAEEISTTATSMDNTLTAILEALEAPEVEDQEGEDWSEDVAPILEDEAFDGLFTAPEWRALAPSSTPDLHFSMNLSNYSYGWVQFPVDGFEFDIDLSWYQPVRQVVHVIILGFAYIGSALAIWGNFRSSGGGGGAPA